MTPPPRCPACTNRLVFEPSRVRLGAPPDTPDEQLPPMFIWRARCVNPLCPENEVQANDCLHPSVPRE